MDVFYWDGRPGTGPQTDTNEYYVWDCDLNQSMPGWYFERFGEPVGPFNSFQDASVAELADARDLKSLDLWS